MIDVVAPEVGEAAVRLLRAADYDVSCDLSQTCCGRPAWSAGFLSDAAEVARPTLEALESELDEGADVVVVPSATCAAMIQLHWPDLFEASGDPVAAERARRIAGRTRELTELLADGSDRLPRLRLTRTTHLVLHHGCQQHRARHASLELLSNIAGCELVAWDGCDQCCGASTERQDNPGDNGRDRLSAAPPRLSDDQVVTLVRSLASAVVGCDAACLLRLRARGEDVETPVQVRHLAEVLADALPAGAGWL